MKNDDISVLNLTVRSYNALKRMGINTVNELETRTADVMKMLPKTYPGIFEAVEEYKSNVLDTTAEPAEKKQELIPAPAEETSAVFDYSELDSDRAKTIASSFNYALLTAEMGDFLKRKEQQLKNEYMNFTANCGQIFAEAQEKLAGNNRYNGFFEKWIEYMGFAKKTVYRMIDVYKFYSCQIDTSKQEIFNELPKMLQYDISAKSAPPELVEQVLNGDITTHKEYIALKAELDRTREECRQIDANSAAKDKEYERDIQAVKSELRKTQNKNTELEAQVKELENRPVEVQQPDEEAISAQAREMAQELIRNAESAADKRIRDYKEKLDSRSKEFAKELENLRNENTRLKDGVLHMVIQLTLDEYGALIKLTQENEALCSAIKHSHIFKS